MSEFKDGMPVDISYAKNLRSDGELSVVRLRQNEQEIQLTLAQAQALIAELRRTVGDKTI